MNRGEPGFGGVLPNEIARSRIAAMPKIEVASMVGPESYKPIIILQTRSRPPRSQVSIHATKSAPTDKAQE